MPDVPGRLPTEVVVHLPVRLAAGHRSGVEVAARATRRLRRLVDGLLDVARAEDARVAVVPVPTDVARLTEDVAGMFRSAIEAAGLELDVRVDALPPLVAVDPDVWSRVLSNLRRHPDRRGRRHRALARP